MVSRKQCRKTEILTNNNWTLPIFLMKNQIAQKEWYSFSGSQYIPDTYEAISDEGGTDDGCSGLCFWKERNDTHY